jgi:hypothetical protein
MIANGRDPKEEDENGNPIDPELLKDLEEPLKRVYKKQKFTEE